MKGIKKKTLDLRGETLEKVLQIIEDEGESITGAVLKPTKVVRAAVDFYFAFKQGQKKLKNGGE